MNLAHQKSHISSIASGQADPVSRVQRLYLEEPSYCLGRHRDIEFKIKKDVADFLGVAYRSVLIVGSAQLGFSPHKGTPFIPGNSDLDLAAVDGDLFREILELCINKTKAFSDLQSFTTRGGQQTADRLREYITRRGMIPISKMPLDGRVTRIEQFLGRLSSQHHGILGGVNLAVYMSESMFCWKQTSGIQQFMDGV